MKIYVAILTAGLLLPGAAIAQSSSTSGDQSGSYAQSQGSYSQQNSQTSQDMSSQNSAAQTSNQQSNQEQTLEGCVTRRETDFYLTPTNGTPVRLRGDQDMSSAENHNARVTGRYSPEQASNTDASTSPYGTTSSSNTTGQSSAIGSQSSLPPDQTGVASERPDRDRDADDRASNSTFDRQHETGIQQPEQSSTTGNQTTGQSSAIGSNPNGVPPSSQAGTATESGNTSAQSNPSGQSSAIGSQNGQSSMSQSGTATQNGPDFFVTRVDSISSTCPANNSPSPQQ